MNNINVIDQNIERIRNEVYNLESSPLITQQKVNILQNRIHKYKEELISIKNTQERGINPMAFCLGFSICHLTLLFTKKKVFFELERKALSHVLVCTGVGLLNGYIVGLNWGKNLGKRWRIDYNINYLDKVHKKLNT